MEEGQSFQETLLREHVRFLESQSNRFPSNEVLIIDLHCHDQNSDVPDELIGRILNVPETWLKTTKLVKILKKKLMS
jgi:hypothetical protein